MGDKRFQRSVIYMCTHSADGAMGIIINQRAKNLSFTSLLVQLQIARRDQADDLELDHMGVHVGGPVASERGFVLHSNDYCVDDATLRIRDGICLTATVDILRAIAAGKGPERSLLALGYSGWASGQLESEIQANGWLHCEADQELVFAPDLDQKYDLALARIGINPSHLVSDAGHA